MEEIYNEKNISTLSVYCYGSFNLPFIKMKSKSNQIIIILIALLLISPLLIQPAVQRRNELRHQQVLSALIESIDLGKSMVDGGFYDYLPVSERGKTRRLVSAALTDDDMISIKRFLDGLSFDRTDKAFDSNVSPLGDLSIVADGANIVIGFYTRTSCHVTVTNGSDIFNMWCTNDEASSDLLRTACGYPPLK